MSYLQYSISRKIFSLKIFSIDDTPRIRRYPGSPKVYRFSVTERVFTPLLIERERMRHKDAFSLHEILEITDANCSKVEELVTQPNLNS